MEESTVYNALLDGPSNWLKAWGGISRDFVNTVPCGVSVPLFPCHFFLSWWP